MNAWPKDNMAAKFAFYGDPRGPHGASPSWESKNLVQIKAPFQMYYAKKPIKSLTCHKKVADSLVRVFNTIWLACEKDQKKVDKTGASDYAGCYNYRVIAGSGSLSNHAFAAAIDLSPATNGFYTKGTTLGSVVIEAFKAEGWRWGGDYKGRKDPMHFEAVS